MPKPVISPNQALEISQVLQPGEEFSILWRCSLAFSPSQSQERALKAFPANWQQKSPASRSPIKPAHLKLKRHCMTGTWSLKPCRIKPTCSSKSGGS